MKLHNLYILPFLAFLLTLSSCVDDDLYIDYKGESDTPVEIEASLSFPVFAPALERSRAQGGSPGTAISDINSLYILIYEKTENPDDGSTVWKLEKDGRILLNAAEHSLKITNPSADRTDKDQQEETETANATFRLRHKAGTFKIYAVANVDLSEAAIPDEDIDTPGKLKAINLEWHTGQENVALNSGMFGYFTNDKNAPVNATETVIISPSRRMHAWIRRAASKVTIAYDGSRLAEGVEIYILSASVRDIPVKCPLGLSNEPDNEKLLIDQGGTIVYYKNNPTVPDPNELVIGRYDAYVTKNKPSYGSDHSVGAEALFFYENMQGEGKDKSQTAPGPGNNDGATDNAVGFPDPDKDTDGSGWKDNKPFGTYVEVNAYYRSVNPKKPGSGIVKYRFMLGKDTKTDYDAERNFHYKLTLNFKGYANDYDWHIDYDPGQVFNVTQPKVFNYAGTVFESNYFWPNGKHKFVPENTITVTSFVGNVNDPAIGFKDVEVSVQFDDASSPWLTYDTVPGDVPYQKNFVFRVRESTLQPDNKYVKRFNLNSLLSTTAEVGTSDNPVNLSDLNRQQINSNANITCTANCYMVDAPGWYIFPLVYGNAIHNGGVEERSYRPYTVNDERVDILSRFRNYKNEDITNAYIQRDLGVSTVTPFLVWQDVDGLVDYSCWAPGANIVFVPNAFYDDAGQKTIGGVKFHVAQKQQGNATIAIGETVNGGATMAGRNLPLAYWSWHIWVTPLFTQLDAKDRTVKVQGHESHRIFDLMPVNLGWCSGADDEIIYYKERRCTVSFTFTGNDGTKKTETREIVKKSHITLTRGHSPYYQWGRKDPFFGVTSPAGSAGNPVPDPVNIDVWMSAGWSFQKQDPIPMTTFTDATGILQAGLLDKRFDTRDALGYSISYPYAWHNPPRVENGAGSGFVSINKTFVNLWEGRPGVDPDAPILKTVYDPCPVGYQVPHINAFSGFTTTGDDSSQPGEWYDVIPANILNYNHSIFGGGVYAFDLYEFYTTPEKTQSTIFPISGYRDWDGRGHMWQYGKIGYAWAAGNSKQGDSQFFNLEFAHNDHNTIKKDTAYIRPRNMFYSCDGFPVRPVRNGDHGSK